MRCLFSMLVYKTLYQCNITRYSVHTLMCNGYVTAQTIGIDGGQQVMD